MRINILPAELHFRVAKFASEFSGDDFGATVLFIIFVHGKAVMGCNVQSHLSGIDSHQIAQSASKFTSIPLISFTFSFLKIPKKGKG